MRKTTIIFLFLLLIISLLIAGCGAADAPAEDGEEPAEGEQAEGEEAPNEEVETAEEGSEETPTEETEGEEGGSAITGNVVSQTGDLGGSIDVLKQQVIKGHGNEKRVFEDQSWFDGVKCTKYTGPSQGTFGSGTKKEDKISFRLVNKDERSYNLLKVSSFSRIGADEKTDVPMRLAINGGRLKNDVVKACCGTTTLEAGQTLECNNCPANLRYPEKQEYMHKQTELKNNLEAKSRFVSTQIEFRCR
jgi:hypothetical protein